MVRAGAGEWVLLTAGDRTITINDVPLIGGLRALQHKDALRLAGSRVEYYFSTEEPVRVEPFAGADEPVFCPRCRSEITGGHVVRCGGCGVLHHEDTRTGLTCFTYAEQCAVCGRPTALGEDLQWTPEEL